MSVDTFNVTLHQLAPGATAPAATAADVTLTGLDRDGLRKLLESFEAMAAALSLYEPAEPELRIRTEHKQYIVRALYGRLVLEGWETSRRGEDHDIAFILATVSEIAVIPAPEKTDEPAAPAAAPKQRATAAATPGLSRTARIALLAVCILGLNAFTAWTLLRPPADNLPPHTLLSTSESRALLTRLAGEYATGADTGDRRLVIGTDGTLQLAKFGPDKTLTEQRTKTLRAASLDGRPALLTNDPAVLTVRDNNTVELFRTVYKRVQP